MKLVVDGSHSSSSGFTGGFSTFPTLQGLLRGRRAVPSLALDEIKFLRCLHLKGLHYGCQDMGLKYSFSPCAASVSWIALPGWTSSPFLIRRQRDPVAFAVE